MKLWNVPAEELIRIVRTVSYEQYEGNIRFKSSPAESGKRVTTVSFTLTVNDSKGLGGRRSHSGRRVAALCWHGHRDIMAAIFSEFPTARLKTARADYRGQDDFNEEFESTGAANIGSVFQPMAYADACDC